MIEKIILSNNVSFEFNDDNFEDCTFQIDDIVFDYGGMVQLKEDIEKIIKIINVEVGEL